MKKFLIGFAFIFSATLSFCQGKILSTENFSFEGKVKKQVYFSIKDISSLQSTPLGNITTLNSEGEVKTIKKNVKGVLLKKLLMPTDINVQKAKGRLSCYLVLVGSDGYKAVLSYNEIFNQSNLYFVTESDGKGIAQTEGRIEVLVLMENKRGHILMKGLSKIVVEQVL